LLPLIQTWKKPTCARLGSFATTTELSKFSTDTDTDLSAALTNAEISFITTPPTNFLAQFTKKARTKKTPCHSFWQVINN